MKDLFSQKAAHKRDIRSRESRLLSSGKASASELGQQNFCMKGVNLNDFRNADGSFSLF